MEMNIRIAEPTEFENIRSFYHKVIDLMQMRVSFLLFTLFVSCRPFKARALQVQWLKSD